MSTEAADAGKLRHAFAVDNCRQPDGTGHGWTGTRSDPDGVQAGQGPISLVVAGEGFEPSKAKPTDLQNTARSALTSGYAFAEPSPCPNRAVPLIRGLPRGDRSTLPTCRSATARPVSLLEDLHVVYATAERAAAYL